MMTDVAKESRRLTLMKWRSLEESAPGTDTRPLRDIFAERKELIAKYVPPETQAVHARVIAELKEKHLAENVLAGRLQGSCLRTQGSQRQAGFIDRLCWPKAAS